MSDGYLGPAPVVGMNASSVPTQRASQISATSVVNNALSLLKEHKRQKLLDAEEQEEFDLKAYKARNYASFITNNAYLEQEMAKEIDSYDPSDANAPSPSELSEAILQSYVSNFDEKDMAAYGTRIHKTATNIADTVFKTVAEKNANYEQDQTYNAVIAAAEAGDGPEEVRKILSEMQEAFEFSTRNEISAAAIRAIESMAESTGSSEYLEVLDLKDSSGIALGSTEVGRTAKQRIASKAKQAEDRAYAQLVEEQERRGKEFFFKATEQMAAGDVDNQTISKWKSTEEWWLMAPQDRRTVEGYVSTLSVPSKDTDDMDVKRKLTAHIMRGSATRGMLMEHKGNLTANTYNEMYSKYTSRELEEARELTKPIDRRLNLSRSANLSAELQPIVSTIEAELIDEQNSKLQRLYDEYPEASEEQKRVLIDTYKSEMNELIDKAYDSPRDDLAVYVHGQEKVSLRTLIRSQKPMASLKAGAGVQLLNSLIESLDGEGGEQTDTGRTRGTDAPTKESDGGDLADKLLKGFEDSFEFEE
mgnify:FL=1